MADQDNTATGGEGSPQAAPQQAGFSIDRIYVKDLSVENPGAPQSFQLAEAPTVEVGLRTRGEQVATDVYECVLTITITATSGGKNVFLVEASQAGLFTIRGVAAQDMQPVLAIACPNVLFPYARETIADAIMRTGFPPVHLAPINFEALYQQQLAQMQQQVPAVTN
jgi:preprotein translocase subunit SecB